MNEAKKYNNPKDPIKAIKKANRDEDIKNHGKPTALRPSVQKNKKKYDRKREKSVVAMNEMVDAICEKVLNEIAKYDSLGNNTNAALPAVGTEMGKYEISETIGLVTAHLSKFIEYCSKNSRVVKKYSDGRIPMQQETLVACQKAGKLMASALNAALNAVNIILKNEDIDEFYQDKAYNAIATFENLRSS